MIVLVVEDGVSPESPLLPAPPKAGVAKGAQEMQSKGYAGQRVGIVLFAFPGDPVGDPICVCVYIYICAHMHMCKCQDISTYICIYIYIDIVSMNV